MEEREETKRLRGTTLISVRVPQPEYSFNQFYSFGGQEGCDLACSIHDRKKE